MFAHSKVFFLISGKVLLWNVVLSRLSSKASIICHMIFVPQEMMAKGWPSIDCEKYLSSTFLDETVCSLRNFHVYLCVLVQKLLWPKILR
jgi:hypothetical protein